ncbi:MAG: DinB family protein [Dehalococcoidia bacterium]|nr:DinB family protein [Dehalococcoidia bacterium]
MRCSSKCPGIHAQQTIEVEWQGKPVSLRAYVPLLQAINHGTEHRGQVAASLTVAGVEPPEIDMWSGMHAGLIG